VKIKPIERPEPTAALDLHALVGRRGAQATLVFHGRKAGVMLDRRTRRLRTRAARNQQAIGDD
jgi:hypothetical protein